MDEEETETRLSEKDRKKVLYTWIIYVIVAFVFIIPVLVCFIFCFNAYQTAGTGGGSDMVKGYSLLFAIPALIGLGIGLISLLFGFLYLWSGFIKANKKRNILLVIACVLIPLVYAPNILIILLWIFDILEKLL